MLWDKWGAVEECKGVPEGASRESGNFGGLKSGRGGEVARSCRGIAVVLPMGMADEEGREEEGSGEGGRVGLLASGTDCEVTGKGVLH